jgi:uncharacterized membrane-anchored protein
MIRPADHPARLALNDEIHARPSEPLYGPTRLSYLAILSPPSARDEERACVAALCARFGSAAPPPTGNHCSVDLGPLRLVWERHSEFVRYTFIAPSNVADAPWDEPPALSLVDADWLETLPGTVIVATHALLTRNLGDREYGEIAAAMFEGNLLAGCEVAGGARVRLHRLPHPHRRVQSHPGGRPGPDEPTGRPHAAAPARNRHLPE